MSCIAVVGIKLLCKFVCVNVDVDIVAIVGTNVLVVLFFVDLVVNLCAATHMRTFYRSLFLFFSCSPSFTHCFLLFFLFDIGQLCPLDCFIEFLPCSAVCLH